MLHSPLEEEVEKPLLRCLIAYAAHLNFTKQLKAWLFRGHQPEDLAKCSEAGEKLANAVVK